MPRIHVEITRLSGTTWSPVILWSAHRRQSADHSVGVPNPPNPVRGLEELRAGRVLAVDLTASHLACCVLDRSGNPVGKPSSSIEVVTAGLAASRRDGRVRAAITALLDQAQQENCGAVVVENLDFATPAPPAGKHWAAASAGNGRAAP